MNEREAMERAIELAWAGWGRVQPNPLVGAVIVKGGRVISEGFHGEYGGPHAEIAALEAASIRAQGATILVTLEPCTHHGKTPPCVDAILDAGVRRVVIAMRESDPQAGGGAERLRSGGVVVSTGLLEAEARAQNALYVHRTSGVERPFVAIKLAISMDAHIADVTGRSQWISGQEAREYVHWLRAGFDAIAVGATTAQRDDPSLTVRGKLQPRVHPLRVLFDRRAEVRRGLTLLDTARRRPTLVMIGPDAPQGPVQGLRDAGAEIERAEEPREALEALWRRGVRSLLVEGGGVLAGRMLAAGVVDRAYIVVAPIWLGGTGIPAFQGVPGVTIDTVTRWRTVLRRPLGGDTLLVLDRPSPPSPSHP